MLSVHVDIHSALRSIYTDSEVLNCDYCELNISVATLQRTLFIYLINTYISLSDICLTVHH